MLNKTSGGSILPAGYTAVDYLESSGTQYINTAIVPTIDLNIYLRCAYNDIGFWMCGAVGANAGARDDLGIGTTAFRFGNTYVRSGIDIGDGTTHAVTLNKQGYSIDGAGTSWASPTSRFSTTRQLYVFGASNSSAAKCGKIGVFRYTDLTDDVLLVSCLDRNARPCMYDIVNGTTYYNAGTGEFTYGQPISDAEIAQRIQEAGYVL